MSTLKQSLRHCKMVVCVLEVMDLKSWHRLDYVCTYVQLERKELPYGLRASIDRWAFLRFIAIGSWEKKLVWLTKCSFLLAFFLFTGLQPHAWIQTLLLLLKRRPLLHMPQELEPNVCQWPSRQYPEHIKFIWSMQQILAKKSDIRTHGVFVSYAVFSRLSVLLIA